MLAKQKQQLIQSLKHPYQRVSKHITVTIPILKCFLQGYLRYSCDWKSLKDGKHLGATEGTIISNFAKSGL